MTNSVQGARPKARPILMSAPMIRALLEGRKTQTRRMMNPQPEHRQYHEHKGRVIYDGESRMWCWKDLVLDNIWDFPNGEDRRTLAAQCSFGKPGDLLWARETWGAVSPDEYPRPILECEIQYRADLPPGCTDQPGEWPADEARGDDEAPKWRPSIRGAAGTGKTTMTRTLLEQVNVPWVILAPSAEASRGVLRREGFSEAETLAKFLIDAPTQEKARNGLIVLDEASLAGAHDMARLIQVADSLNSRVLLLGDRRQHKSVARGDVLTLLEDRAGLPVAEVSEIRRQGGEYREAVKLASQGRVSDAFSKLDKLGWVKQGGHEQIAEDYTAAIRDGKSVLVVSPTHAEGDQVTAAIRAKLKAEGRLKGEERTFDTLVPLHLTDAERGQTESYQDGLVAVFHRAGAGHRAGQSVPIQPENVQSLALAARQHSLYRRETVRLTTGDSVRITANGKDLSGTHRLNNGATYTVTGFTDTGNIRLNNGWTISKDFGHLSHGYAVTSHAAQGRTVDRVLIAQSAQSFPASGKEQFYVSISRGKERATVYTSDKVELRDAIQREDKRMLASDLVRAPKKGVRDRLKRRVSFLRDLGSRLMDHARGHGMQKGRNAVHERD